MAERFSPTLRIGDLSDFIAPSQSCVVSLKSLRSSPAVVSKKRIDKPELIPDEHRQTDPVRISLKDCLACSGCITSAETVMLEKQSVEEFISKIRKRPVIVSLSPQSRASLAVHFSISQLQVLQKLTTFFKSLGVRALFDTSCSRDISLIESCNEFITRYKQNQSGEEENPEASLPMLSSSCPGWICYAEKQLGSYILPYISSVKSPQQTIGAAIKHHVGPKLGFRADEICHTTVMPCYDKKLEASREEFNVELESSDDQNLTGVKVSEVDSVLTTGEVLDLIKMKEVDFKSLDESPLDAILTNVEENGQLFGVPGSSDGFAETVFRYAAKSLFGIDVNRPLSFKTLRNTDFREVTLEENGKVLLKFALCYGFQNLQNVVRKIKMGRCDYQFVEVMACPSGCLNGGGQIKPKSGQSPKELLGEVENVYMQDVFIADPFENPAVKRLYDEWLERPGSDKAKRFMHTKYHQVEKSITSQLHNW